MVPCTLSLREGGSSAELSGSVGLTEQVRPGEKEKLRVGHVGGAGLTEKHDWAWSGECRFELPQKFETERRRPAEDPHNRTPNSAKHHRTNPPHWVSPHPHALCLGSRLINHQPVSNNQPLQPASPQTDTDSTLVSARPPSLAPRAEMAPPAGLIQSISIPSYTTKSDPPPTHIVYSISVTTPSNSYSVAHRYSDFDALHSALAQELGTAPPVQLPPKQSSRFLGMFGSATLPEAQLRERQAGLDNWLRAIVAARDPRWAASRALREFLAPPAGQAAGPDSFTPASWLDEHKELAGTVRSLRAAFARRDELTKAGSAGAHAANGEAKKGLVDLVRRLGRLTAGLQDLAKGGMPQGELHRRGDLVGSLQDEAETLGKVAASGPRAGSSSLAAQHANPTPPTPADRNALLSSSSHNVPPSRVLGAAAAKETAATRPLDNAGLLQLQQAYVVEQDDKLDALTAGLRRQRELAEQIGSELALHSELLDGLDKDVDRVGGRMKAANQQMKRLK